MKENQTAMHPRVLPLLLGLVIPPAPLAWPGGQRNRHKMYAAGASVAGCVALSAIQPRLGDGPGCVVMCVMRWGISSAPCLHNVLQGKLC
jgi:hypothetical protein